MKYDMGYEHKELEKVRKLAWVAGERKAEDEEELYAEEDKGRFWGEQPLRSLDWNNSLPQNLFCLLRHSSKKKKKETHCPHISYLSLVVSTPRGWQPSTMDHSYHMVETCLHTEGFTITDSHRPVEKKSCLLHKLIGNCQSMKDSLSVKARKHYPRKTDATPVCIIISLCW